jgi:V/A-type H+-transporting ATPase subunit E
MPAPPSAPYSADAQHLAAVIRAQAADESVQVLDTAREQAARIRAAADAEAAAIRSAAEREGAARGQRRATELLAVARAEQQRQWLHAREALIEVAFASARARWRELATLPGGGDALAGLVREALPLFPDGVVRLRVAERDAALLTREVLAALEERRWSLRVDPDSGAGGGVILESEDGRLRYDNSLDARSARGRDRLRGLAAAVLLDHPPAGAGTP